MHRPSSFDRCTLTETRERGVRSVAAGTARAVTFSRGTGHPTGYELSEGDLAVAVPRSHASPRPARPQDTAVQTALTHVDLDRALGVDDADAAASLPELVRRLAGTAQENEQLRLERAALRERLELLEEQLRRAHRDSDDATAPAAFSSEAAHTLPRASGALLGIGALDAMQQRVRELAGMAGQLAHSIAGSERSIGDTARRVSALSAVTLSSEKALRSVQRSAEQQLEEAELEGREREQALRKELSRLGARALSAELELKVAEERHGEREKALEKALRLSELELAAAREETHLAKRQASAHATQPHRTRSADTLDTSAASVRSLQLRARDLQDAKEKADARCEALRSELECERNAALVVRKELSSLRVDVRLFDETLDGFEAQNRQLRDEARAVRQGALEAFTRLHRASESFVRGVGADLELILRDIRDPAVLGGVNFESVSARLIAIRKEVGESRNEFQRLTLAQKERWVRDQALFLRRFKEEEGRREAAFGRLIEQVAELRVGAGSSQIALEELQTAHRAALARARAQQTEGAKQLARLARRNEKLRAKLRETSAYSHALHAKYRHITGSSKADFQTLERIRKKHVATRQKLSRSFEQIERLQKRVTDVAGRIDAAKEACMGEAAEFGAFFEDLKQRVAHEFRTHVDNLVQTNQALSARANLDKIRFEEQLDREREAAQELVANLSQKLRNEATQARQELVEARAKQAGNLRGLEEQLREATEERDRLRQAVDGASGAKAHPAEASEAARRAKRQNKALVNENEKLRLELAELQQNLHRAGARTKTMNSQLLEFAEVQESLQARLSATRRKQDQDRAAFERWQQFLTAEAEKLSAQLGGEAESRQSAQRLLHETQQRARRLEAERDETARALRDAEEREQNLTQALRRAEGEIEVVKAQAETRRRTLEAEAKAALAAQRFSVSGLGKPPAGPW